MTFVIRATAMVVTLLLAHPSATPAEKAERATQPDKPNLTVCAVGDINMGSDYPSDATLPPEQGKKLFLPVANMIKGDVIFGNLEGPLIDGGKTDKCATSKICYAFRSPTAFGGHLKKAGFTVLSLANNHAMDFGEAGRQSTINTLDALGLLHTGPVGDIAKLTVYGKQIAVVAFGTAEHSYNLLEIDQAAQTVSRLKKENDLVMVSFHGGAEGSGALHVKDLMEYLGSEPRGNLINFAHQVVDAGADLVIGHGPHVLRGLELYRQRLIAYSLGNFCTFGRFNLKGPLGVSVVLSAEIDLESGRFVKGKMHPVYQQKPGGPLPDPRARGIRLIRRLSKEDFPFGAPVISEQGSIFAPPGEGAGLFSLKQPEDRNRLSNMLKTFSKQGLKVEKLREWFGDRRAEIIPKVITRMQKPAEHLSYEKYRLIFINREVIDAGIAFFNQHKKLLNTIEKRFKVDQQALLGLVGVESRFGKHSGTYRVFNALSTIALYHPRRSGWAQKELKTLLSQFPDDPLTIKGSYAGAIGFVQFMPTSIRAYAVDFDKDGKINLDKWEDALASAANYLKKHGWRHKMPIRKGNANYRSVFRYNPDHNYVKVIKELSIVLRKQIAKTTKKH